MPHGDADRNVSVKSRSTGNDDRLVVVNQPDHFSDEWGLPFARENMIRVP
jgi:hypothetical protein